jgi:hypothetical protein
LRTSQTADNEPRDGPFHFGKEQAKYTYSRRTRVVLAGKHSNSSLPCTSPNLLVHYGPGRRSRYSNWPQAGRPRGRSSNTGRVKVFLFSTSSKPALGLTQPPIKCVPGALSPRVKRMGREDNHSPPTSAEVKKTWIYTSTPPYVFMA